MKFERPFLPNATFTARQAVCVVVALLCLAVLSATGTLQAQTAPAGPPQTSLVEEFDRLNLPAKSQGGRGTCSLFAVTALAAFEYACSATEPREPLSEEFLVWAANEATGRTGDQAMFYEAVHGLNVRGICTDTLMPYLPTGDPGREPSAPALTDAEKLSRRWKVHWIKRWDVQRRLSDTQLALIKQALAANHPVACGLRWPKVPTGNHLLEAPPAAEVFDGHSIALAGYREDPAAPGGGLFQFRNSFGPQWADRGYGLISFAYVRAYANDILWLELGPPKSELPMESFEADLLSVLGRSRCVETLQNMSAWGPGMWSGGTQLFCRSEKGGYLEVGLAVPDSGRYRVRLMATAGPDYGIIRVDLDGAKSESVFDLYSGLVCPAGSLELGVHELEAGEHRIRFTVLDRNPASANFFFGIDTIELLAAR